MKCWLCDQLLAAFSLVELHSPFWCGHAMQVSVREVLAVRDVLLAAGPGDFLQPVNFREQMDAQMTSTMDEDGR